jgi:hypothetical protein
LGRIWPKEALNLFAPMLKNKALWQQIGSPAEQRRAQVPKPLNARRKTQKSQKKIFTQNGKRNERAKNNAKKRKT